MVQGTMILISLTPILTLVRFSDDGWVYPDFSSNLVLKKEEKTKTSQIIRLQVTSAHGFTHILSKKYMQ